MKGYQEYLDLYLYFARSGEPRLSRDEYSRADVEFRELAARHPHLDSDGRARLGELKAILFRDKP